MEARERHPVVYFDGQQDVDGVSDLRPAFVPDSEGPKFRPPTAKSDRVVDMSLGDGDPVVPTGEIEDDPVKGGDSPKARAKD